MNRHGRSDDRDATGVAGCAGDGELRIIGERADRAIADLASSTSPWLDDEPDDRADAELNLRLRTLLDPGGDLTTRTQIDVDRALRGRSVLSTGLELLGLGLATARTLLSDLPEGADREPEGT